MGLTHVFLAYRTLENIQNKVLPLHPLRIMFNSQHSLQDWRTPWRKFAESQKVGKKFLLSDNLKEYTQKLLLFSQEPQTALTFAPSKSERVWSAKQDNTNSVDMC